MDTLCIPDCIAQETGSTWPKKLTVLVKKSPCVPYPPCPESPDDAPEIGSMQKSEPKPAIKKEEKSVNGNNKKKRSRSCELRGGTVFHGCDCERHNGLQDDCPRTGCHGSPDCVNFPKPVCSNSEFSNHKHLKYVEKSKRAKFRYDVFSVTNQPAVTSYYIIN